MIYKMQFTNGFPLQLPNIGNKIFEFTDGINILFAPTGSGKSTILKTIKAYNAIEKFGWSRLSQPTVLGTAYVGRMTEAVGFPHCYKEFSPSKCMANVLHDGLPSFFSQGNVEAESTFFFQSAGQSQDGVITEQEQMEMLTKNPSSGQYRLYAINKMIEMLTKYPLTIAQFETMPPRCQYPNIVQNEINWWRNIRRPIKSKNTILLDEIERSLSLPLQKELFLNTIPTYLKDYQVIIATHSIYALQMKNVNIIDIEAGYVAKCKELIKELANNI